MAVPGSGALSLYGLAKEKELNNYDNTIPISTYNSFYATPISLGNLATGAGGFDATNLNASFFPNSIAPHAMSEWRGYDHDEIWTPYYAANPINKAASYLFWPYGDWGTICQSDSYRYAEQLIRKIGYTSWTVDQSNVYRNGIYSNYQRVSETLDFIDWGSNDPFFATNAENRVFQRGGYCREEIMELYIETSISWRLYDIVVTSKYASIYPESVTNSNSYIYVKWKNTRTDISGDIFVDFKFYPNPLI